MAMPQNLDDPVFWLPPLFLSDDDHDFNKTDFPFSDSNSGFTSPLDSSTETESDQDDFLTDSIHLSHHLWNPKPFHASFLPAHKTDTLWKMPESPPQSDDKNHSKHGNGRAGGLSQSGWPSLQQSQSRKLAVPWTNAAPVKCSGTGVFLPRPVPTTPTQTHRRKHHSASASLKQRNVSTQSQQKRNVSTQSQQRRDMSRSPATMHNEIRLPQEWTY